jgi:tetratricopeptide (TPR) repeat protein
MGHLTDAIRHYRQAAKCDEGNAAAQSGSDSLQKAVADQELAKKQLASRHFQSCLEVVARVLEISPAAHNFTAIKAQCFIGLDEFDQANALIASVLVKAPQDSDALYARGLLHCKQGKLETIGVGHFRQVLRTDPEHANSLASLKAAKGILKAKTQGNENFHEGKYAIAVELYTTALELDPVNHLGLSHILLVNRAVVKGKLGTTDAAISDCTRALEISPGYTKARMKRADLFVEKGDLEEAQTDYDAVISAEPGHAQRLKIDKALRDIAFKVTAADKESEDFYAVLGVTATATEAEIKKSYRKMALKHHPDRVQGEQEKRRAEKQFKQITKAYQTLSDTTEKSKYDRERRKKSGGGGGYGGYGGGGGGGFPSYDQQSGFGGRRQQYGYGQSASGGRRSSANRGEYCSCGMYKYARSCSSQSCAKCCQDDDCPRHGWGY